MRRIVVMNTKGGCGKTTITTNLVSYYASRGYNTALFDYDVQGSSTHWLKQRSLEYPPIHGVQAFRQSLGVTRAWQTRVPPGTQRLVLDTPASMDRLELMERVRGADVILIPVLPSPIDTHAAANFIRDLMLIAKLRSDRTRIGIIPNRVRESTLGFQALQRFLRSLNIHLVVCFTLRNLYTLCITVIISLVITLLICNSCNSFFVYSKIKVEIIKYIR